MDLKVLIIDDEVIILEGLCEFPWEEFGCYVAGRAMNADDALEIADKIKPNLIFTDIKMPGMDGLEFAERVKKITPDAEIVLLTGYDSFEFAQRAIRLGIRDYLLKPINYNEMKKLIARISNEIRTRHKDREYYEELVMRYKKMLPMLRSKLSYDLLHGHFRDREEMNKKLTWLDIRIERYLVITAKAEENQERAAEIEPWLLEFALLNICEEILKEYSELVLSDCDDRNLSFIINFDRKITENDIMNNSVKACEKIQQVIWKFAKLNLCMGISEVSTDCYLTNKYYLQSLEACRQGTYFGNDTILQYGDVAVSAEEWYIMDGEKQGLFSEILTGDAEKVREHIEHLFENSSNDLNILKSEALGLLIECLHCLKSNNKNKNSDYSISNAINLIYACTNKAEVEEYLKKTFNVIAIRNGRSDIDKHQAIVKNIITYIEDHYMDDISLDLLADTFHLSKTYISRLLKQYVQKSFLEILIDTRMTMAERLIKENKCKINRISELVGFHDFSYFIQVFKKKFGITPNEYRKNV
jgi:Response regulator containing CheY-like receiver domain and AraC-type DNA-binding domain